MAAEVIINTLLEDGRLPDRAAEHAGQIAQNAVGKVVPRLEQLEAAPEAEIGAAVTATRTMRDSEAVYRKTLADADTAARGVLVYKSDFEDAARWKTGYGSWVATVADARSGTKVGKLPMSNTNTANGKPTHFYMEDTVSVVQGTKYELRVWAKHAGAPTADRLQVLVAKMSGTTQTYYGLSSYVLLSNVGVSDAGYTQVRIPWTAPETMTVRFGPQTSFQSGDVQIDDFEVADVTNIRDMSTEVAAAKAQYDSDRAAALTAWEKFLPDGVGGGDALEAVTRAEHAALKAKGTLDPNKNYLVTL